MKIGKVSRCMKKAKWIFIPILIRSRLPGKPQKASATLIIGKLIALVPPAFFPVLGKEVAITNYVLLLATIKTEQAYHVNQFIFQKVEMRPDFTTLERCVPPWRT